MYNCKFCAKEIPAARVDFLLKTGRQPVSCVEHSTERAVVGFPVFPHKTGSQVVVIKGDDEEGLRLAERAHQRSR